VEGEGGVGGGEKREEGEGEIGGGRRRGRKRIRRTEQVGGEKKN
jgi:hypothetical protein